MKSYVFTRTDTKIMKGVAILLMLMHHLWGFPERQPGGAYAIQSPVFSQVLGKEWFAAVGQFGKICLPVFMFLTGYGMYRQYESGKLSVERKIGRFYISYWKTASVMLAAAFLFFRSQEQLISGKRDFSRLYSSVHQKDLAMTLIGFSKKYNLEWWYVGCFVIAVLFGYLYILLTRKLHNGYIELFIGFMICLTAYQILPMLKDVPSFAWMKEDALYNFYLKQGCVGEIYAGITFARYHALDRAMTAVMSWNVPSRIAFSLAGGLVIFNLRAMNDRYQQYFYILTPAFVIVSMNLIRLIRFLDRPLAFLGAHSENLWLTHSFFCYYFSFFVKIVYASGNAFADLAVLLALSLAASLLIEAFCALAEKMVRAVSGRVSS